MNIECIYCEDGEIVCPICRGSGYAETTEGYIRTKQPCNECNVKGYKECEYCSKDRYDNKIKNIKDKIEFFCIKNSINNLEKKQFNCIIDNLLKDITIKNLIEDSERISLLTRKNRHGLKHALKVVDNSLGLYNLIYPHYRSNLSLSESLKVIIISSFCHDIRRAFSLHPSAGALTIRNVLDDFYNSIRIKRKNTSKEEIIMPLIEDCIYYHSGEEEIPSVLECSLLTLADGLDCGKHRVQPYIKWWTVIREDRKPVEYFANICIDNVIYKSTDDKLVEFIFYLNGGAGFNVVKNFMERIKNTYFSRRINSSNFAIKVCFEGNTKLIWP